MLAGARDWLINNPETPHLNIGYFGASRGTLGALVAGSCQAYRCIKKAIMLHRDHMPYHGIGVRGSLILFFNLRMQRHVPYNTKPMQRKPIFLLSYSEASIIPE
jgi:hypothetical protein